MKKKREKKTRKKNSRHRAAPPGKRSPKKHKANNPIETIAEYLGAGKDTEAVTFCRRLLASQDNDPTLFTTMAKVFARHKKIAFAAELTVLALETAPENPDCLVTAGWIQMQAGNTGAAVDCLQEALRHEPYHRGALEDLSNLLIRLQQWSDALVYLKRLNEITPDNSSILLALGSAWLQMNKPARALPVLRRCMELEPASTDAAVCVSVALRLLKRFAEAKKTLSTILREDPDNISALNALSSLHADQFRFDHALECSQKALTLDPYNLEALNSHAYASLKHGEIGEALRCYKQVLAADGSHAKARFGYGAVRMLLGDLQGGLPYYEARFEVMQSWLDGPWPLWDGRDANGKTILVRSEQGVGDTIQFSRFLPLLQEAGAKVIFSCQPSLGRLMKSATGIDRLYPVKELPVQEIQADAQIALLSLMGVFGITLETIPAHCPYLTATEPLKQHLSGIVDRKRKMKVGLIWAGNPEQSDDHNRSLHLSQLSGLGILRSEIQFYSFQVGYAAEQIEKHGNPLDLIDLSPFITDFADTAALMEQMDLIVSVCTSTIHLAGALARPAVVLLPFAADWRWFLDREDSPWYPTVHIMRQPSPGQWEPVIDRLGHYLRRLIKAHDRQTTASVHTNKR